MARFLSHDADRRTAIIVTLKNAIECYELWKRRGPDANGKTIQPHHTKFYNECCKQLEEMGEKITKEDIDQQSG